MLKFAKTKEQNSLPTSPTGESDLFYDRQQKQSAFTLPWRALGKTQTEMQQLLYHVAVL